MGVIKDLKRKIVVPLLYHSGLPFRSFSGNKNIILNYHGVLPEPFPRINNRHLSTTQFEADLKFLLRHFQVVTLTDIFTNPVAAGSNQRPKVAITFDDGFENNLSYALPILEKYNCPATIFVLSASIEDPHYVNWADLVDLAYVLPEWENIDLMGKNFVRGANGYQSQDANPILLPDFIKNQGQDRLLPLEQLAQKVLKSTEASKKFHLHLKLMDAHQVKQLAQSKVIEIGSHSKYHFNLGRVEPRLAEDELRKSKTEIEELIQKEVKSIAYPDGDYSSQVKDLAEQAGYPMQLAVDFRLKEDPADNRIRRRFSYSNSTTHASNMVRLGFEWKKYSF